MSKEPKATNMFSPTTTRFFASLTMTLVMWMACWVGAVAEEPFNPGPCLLPYDCIKSPALSGVISGPTVVCIGVPATWTLNESFTPGLKQKCEETAVAVTKTSSQWVWNYNGGPEPSLGYILGTSFTSTFTQEGTYTIYWNGIANLSDSVCDYVSSKVEMTFTVQKPKPEAALTSIVTKPDPMCIDEESEGICSIGDQSKCDAGPYTVKWKVESDGGPQNLQFTPSSGQVALTFGQSVDITFKIKAGAGAKGGTAKYKLTATVNGVDQTSSGKIDVIELKSVTHNAPEYQPWAPGATVAATAVVEGGLGNKEIHYKAINVHTGAVVGSLSVASTSATLPINQPGKYRIEVTLCDKTVLALPFFTLWQVVLDQGEKIVVWDDLIDNVLNPEPWKAVEDSQKAIKQAVADGNLVSKELVDKKVKSVQDTIQNSINDLATGLTEIDQKTVLAQKQIEESHKLTDQLKSQLDLKGLSLEAEKLVFETISVRIKANNTTRAILETLLSRADDEITRASIRERIALVDAEISQLNARKALSREAITRIQTEIDYLRLSLDIEKTKRIDLKAKIIKLKKSEADLLKEQANLQKQKGLQFEPATKNTLRILGDVARILDGIGVILDLQAANTAFADYKTARTDAERKITEAKNYVEANKAALEAWMKSEVKRKKGPHVFPLDLRTIPGLLAVKFIENPSFVTKDSNITPNEVDHYTSSPGAYRDSPPIITPHFKHFSFINGIKQCWENDLSLRYSSTGASGQIHLDISLMGNLGHSTISATVAGVSAPGSAVFTSKGKTQEDVMKIYRKLLEQNESVLTKARDDMNLISALILGVAAAWTVAAIVCSFLFTVTFAALGGAIALAVGAAIGIVTLIGNLLFDLLAAADPLPNSIKTLFPSESPRNLL